MKSYFSLHVQNLLFLWSFLGMLFFAQFAFAQSELPEGFGDYRSIKNPEPGKVYTQAYIPPTFKKIVWKDSVLLLENNQHLIENLEEGKDYDILTEIVEIRPAYTVWEFEEPTMDTIIETKTIIVDRICEEIEPMPKFENQVIIERQKMFDESFMFISYTLKKDFIQRCMPYELQKNKNTVFLSYAMIEVPARYKSYKKQVFQKEGKWWTETIEDTLTARRSHYRTTGVRSSSQQIPAILDTFYRIVVHENVISQLTEPNFSIIQKQIIDKEGYFWEWREAICGPSCGSSRIRQIQEALVKKGYQVTIDNIFDKETKAALLQFQKDNNLPQGQLDTETLKSLGVEF